MRSIAKDPELVRGTLEMAEQDLVAAEKSFERSDYVWASVQTYTSMLNFARALLFADGIREKSHYCVVQYLAKNRSKELGDLVDKLDILRRERHMTMYDSRGHITAENVNKHLYWCRDFKEKTLKILGDQKQNP